VLRLDRPGIPSREPGSSSDMNAGRAPAARPAELRALDTALREKLLIRANGSAVRQTRVW